MKPSFVMDTNLESKASHWVRAVRKIHPERPVLLLAQKHDQDLIWQAMNAGAYDILVKPVDEGTLLLRHASSN